MSTLAVMRTEMLFIALYLKASTLNLFSAGITLADTVMTP
jgi:hypothetical protein